jgi:hypothetical protein
LPAAVLDAVVEDLAGVHAAAAIGLHDHALHPAAIGEVVDIIGAEIGRDRVVDVLEGDTECAGFFAIYHKIDLRRRRQALDIDLLQDVARVGFADQPLGRGVQGGKTFLATILKPETETGGVAEIVDRRRLQRRYPGIADRREILVDVSHDRGRGILLRTLRPVL